MHGGESQETDGTSEFTCQRESADDSMCSDAGVENCEPNRGVCTEDYAIGVVTALDSVENSGNS